MNISHDNVNLEFCESGNKIFVYPTMSFNIIQVLAFHMGSNVLRRRAREKEEENECFLERQYIHLSINGLHRVDRSLFIMPV